MNDQNITASVRFQKAADLFQESWQIYRLKIKTLSGIMAVLVGFNVFSDILINLLLNSDLKFSVLFSVILAITSLVSLFLWFLSIPSLLFAIKEEIGIKESYIKGFKALFSFTWIYFLFSVLVLGVLVAPSTLLGFLMSLNLFNIISLWPILWPLIVLIDLVLIIIGILFFVWFSLSFFTFCFEGKKGMDAILRSKFLISGNFWKILSRYLALVIIVFAVPISVLFLSAKIEIFIPITNGLRSFINYVLEFFAIPFILIYGSLIYKNLAETKNEIIVPEEQFLKRKLNYVLPGIMGALVVGLVVLFWSSNIIWGRDERPTDDSDLRLARIEMGNEKENAFYWIIPWMGAPKDSSGNYTINEMVLKYWPEGKERVKEKKELYLPSDKTKIIDDMIAGKTWDDSFAQELLEKNKEMFDDFDKAATSSYFQDPVSRNPDNINPSTQFFSIAKLRNIAKINTIKSAYFFRQGKEKEAFDESFKLIRLGSLIKNSQGTTINYLIATTIKEMGLNQIRTMLAKTNLSPEDLRNYISRLEELKDNGQGLAKALKAEYINYNYYKKIIDMAFEGKLSKEDLVSPEIESGNFNSLQKRATQKFSYLYKPNRTQRFNIEDARLGVNNAFEEYYKDMNFNEEKITQVNSQINSMGPAIIFTDNPIGKIFYSMGAVSAKLSGVFSKKIHENFSIVGTQTLMALKIYKNEKGDLPESLANLVPGYLSERPIDYFDGKPVRYSKENKMIYSVGQDLKDSGGKSSTDFGDKNTDDINYKIGF